MLRKTANFIIQNFKSLFLIIAVILFFTPNPSLGTEIPIELRGYWCARSKEFKGNWGAFKADVAECDNFKLSISSSEMKIIGQGSSCVIQNSSSFDVCPWGMIFKDRELAIKKRAGQINPWSPGFHLVFACSDSTNRSEKLAIDLVLEKGSIVGGVPTSYRCPWARK